jgi:hypothetical protein
VDGRSDDDGGDDSCGYGGEDIVAVDFAPRVSTRWPLEMIAAIVDLAASAPVAAADVGTTFPVAMADVVVLVTTAVAIGRILREGESAAKESGKSRECNCFIDQFHQNVLLA